MIPNRLKQTLDREYGTDGWTLIGIDGDNILIKFYLSDAIITFDRNLWL
jgi:hypothetical protein